jgi:hypothetical protein
VSETYIGDSGRERKTGSALKVFPGESSVLWHRRRRCLRVSLPSWGRRCGYLRRDRVPGENPWPSVSAMAAHCVVTLLGASSWSPCSSCSLIVILSGKCWSFAFFLVYFDLLCKGSPHHLVSVRPMWLYL